MRLRLFLWLSLICLTAMLPIGPAGAIVNGEDATNPNFQAVVSFGGCTGTFVHANFIVTAAHCLPRCANASDTGCITGSSNDVFKGRAVGRDGPVSGLIARDGLVRGTGNPYPIDYVYFARASDIDRSRPPDVAILRTTGKFSGRIIPILPNQDRPRPDEDNYCRRWEYTWPWVLGYSTNADTADARRRVGRAFAECDLEMDETVFKLDGHGRDGQRGIRICRGDSGGPVLWETGFGGFGVGGINSGSDDYKVLTDTQCPSERGEGFHAFIPNPFLDRVARTDSLCGSASNWGSCRGVPTPYGGYRLRYLGTEIDQCGRNSLRIPSNFGNVYIAKGKTAWAEVSGRRYSWYCGDSREWTTAREGARLIIAKRAITDRQIIWDTYRIERSPN
jgi:hypothetical protein